MLSHRTAMVESFLSAGLLVLAPLFTSDDALAQTPPPLPTWPGAGDGVVARDGGWVAGRVERTASRVRVVPASGVALELPLASVALIVSGADAELVDSQTAVESACAAPFRATHRTALVPLVERYLGAGLVSEARLVLDEARTFGLEEKRWAALDRRVRAGRSASPGRALDKKRETIAVDESAIRRQNAAGFAQAAQWCARKSLWTAQAGLVAAMRVVAPDEPWKASEFLPDGFPKRDAQDALARWVSFAPILSLTNVNLIPRSDALWKHAEGNVWRDDALALRTPEIALFTLELDVRILRDCLSRTSQALRAISSEIGAGARPAAEHPLVVLLHEKRQDYLAEPPPSGYAAPPWSCGYYSWTDRVSRFYVPRETGKDANVHELARVLVHELTHQWTSEAWLGSNAAPANGDPAKPGFWMVEGLARFTEDQLHDVSDAPARFDDERVHSVRVAAALARQRRAFSCDRLVDMSQFDFASLPTDELLCSVEIAGEKGPVALSQASAFYEQSGALVFFLLNRAGPERRARALDYARDFYAKKTQPEGWRVLGFSSPEALEDEFAAFLGSAGR